MKSRNHARLGKAGRATRKPAKASTGRLTALAIAGRSVGRFNKGPRDLSANRKHLEGFGE
jgi:hypothetical protein